jgi:hypothetical protein
MSHGTGAMEHAADVPLDELRIESADLIEPELTE